MVENHEDWRADAKHYNNLNAQASWNPFWLWPLTCSRITLMLLYERLCGSISMQIEPLPGFFALHKAQTWLHLSSGSSSNFLVVNVYVFMGAWIKHYQQLYTLYTMYTLYIVIIVYNVHNVYSVYIVCTVYTIYNVHIEDCGRSHTLYELRHICMWPTTWCQNA